jgi:hypothetical protein
VAHQLNYSTLDRLLHRLAFAAPFLQLTAADVEKAVWGRTYSHVAGARPVFITSLPRAGTTLLLDALTQFPSFASHSYRDMPFILAPIFWSHLSGPFQQAGAMKERAHADGVEVGFDSPEAFEEVIWRTFWPKKYGADSIGLWSARDEDEEAHAFFVDHIRKIIALRRPDRAATARYLSKNNANIARLDLIDRMFPDAQVLLCVRRPLAHARSLLQQHRRFLAMHRDEPFVRRYMEDIGHYEFGELHRPIRFDQMAPLMAGRDPLTLDYWLAYWIAAFDRPLTDRPNLRIVPYDELCASPMEILPELCRWLELDPEGLLGHVAALFQVRDRPARDDEHPDPVLLERAEAIHARMVEGAQVQPRGGPVAVY